MKENNLGSKIMFNGIKMCFTNIKQSTGSINVFMEHLTQEILRKKKLQIQTYES